MPVNVVYPWSVELADKEFQCVYCGRFMDDPKAVRRVRENGLWLHACVACGLILSVSRLATLESKQDRVQDLLKIEHSPSPESFRCYVNRQGVGVMKRRKT